jgi:DNA-binding SARP family transcriptional activator/tetratricopeptide (TPR) repeat protein
MAQPPVKVTLLGPFAVTCDGRVAGPWPRPTARRLCQLVLVAPGRRITRDLACEELFPDLDPHAAARSVSKALSMARSALAGLGGPAASLVMADLTHIWVPAEAAVEVDADLTQTRLRTALSMAPGLDRDDTFTAALADDGELLADEPYTQWALRPRERLEALRQQARLTLARDRAKGAGRSRADAVTQAWEACFEHDPAAEEAAAALVRAYSADGQRELAVRVYERCAAALDELGLRVSPLLAEVYAAAAAQAAAALPAQPAPLREELRTVTVLAAEVISPAGLDPESLRDLVTASLTTVIAEAEVLGGTVTSVSGGGLQVMFGAPQAHEDDPERAVRAAFRAVSALGGRVRIGVETGQALLGPIGGGSVGGGSSRGGYGPVGAVVGIATTLQASAGPGSALIGPVTRAAIGHLFTWVAGGSAGASATAAQLGAPRAPGELGLVRRGRLTGRGAEMAVLEQALRETTSGRGSFILVTGEPGLGKTRLVQEGRKLFLARAGARGGKLPVWLEGRGASFASATPYGLYQQLLASWIGVAADQPPAVLQPALERALRSATGDTELLGPLARMMGLPAGAELGRMGPEELRRTIFAALHALISRLLASGPAVLALEDLHWADPTSLQLTNHLARLTTSQPLLVLATSRPGPDLAAIDEFGPVRRVTLRPLPARAQRELVLSLIGGPVSSPALDAVLASADGNPLFLEERLSSLLETKALLDEDGTWRLGETAGTEIPQVLERLVLSRVDRLSPAARDVARAASVLGAEFSLPALTAVCAADEPPAAAVRELRASDLIHEVDAMYRFRHVLIKDAIYQGLPRAERRQLHGRAAWALEAATAGSAEAAAVLGGHFAAAGEDERAVRYLELAGDYATGIFANGEAISSYRAALTIAPDASMLAKLANVLWRTARRDEARAAFEEALRVVRPGDPLLRVHLLTRLGRLEMVDSRYQAATAAFDAAQQVFGDDAPADDDLSVDRWLELMLDGRASLDTQRGEPERALAILAAVRPVLAARGSPARVCTFHSFLAQARVMKNRWRVDPADIADMRRAVAAAVESDDEKDVGYAMSFLGRFLMLHGDLAEAQRYQEQALAIAERIGESLLLEDSLIGLAYSALRRHDVAAVRALAPRIKAAVETTKGAWHHANLIACLVWLAWQEDRPADVIALSGQIAQLGVELSFGWVFLWPLLAVRLDEGDLTRAVAVAERLLDPGRQRLPDQIEAALHAAVGQGGQDGQGTPEAAKAALAGALALAREHGYC